MRNTHGKDFAALRAFAKRTIPILLRERGGEMDKEEMHQEIERLFSDGQPLPAALEQVDPKNGVRVKRNANAFAMKELVEQRVLEPSSGKRTVRLTKAAMMRYGLVNDDNK